ncbi:hypothetical protein AZH53_03015 [Methanomicrobiaceae archaeon CYW5]|uniref:type IV pilin N-terminal domain-containing protein n=1 Tax=Methanovulcanius yangii TaxID=1789227 RepID=UPI0029CA4907|nr:type IV pilin N-terminal domain-containing protein [Methanovulcanius yangii]MBT8507401.1 hypothetical protein [Methanovulcanius yangii]
MKFMNDEEAVSPVIGVILMVAITVILAAVIAVFVFGMAGDVQTTKVVTVTAKQVGEDVQVTFQGGSDAGEVTDLEVTVYKDNQDDASNVTGPIAFDLPLEVGSTMMVGAASAGDDMDRVLVVATFSDGTTQVIYDNNV